MLHSVCDLSGSTDHKNILRNGALALAGMVRRDLDVPPSMQPLIILQPSEQLKPVLQTCVRF